MITNVRPDHVMGNARVPRKVDNYQTSGSEPTVIMLFIAAAVSSN